MFRNSDIKTNLNLCIFFRLSFLYRSTYHIDVFLLCLELMFLTAFIDFSDVCVQFGFVERDYDLEAVQLDMNISIGGNLNWSFAVDD